EHEYDVSPKRLKLVHVGEFVQKMRLVDQREFRIPAANLVGDRSYSSHGVDFADNVSFDGMGSPRKEKTVVLDFQNSIVSLPFGKHTMGVSSFHSGYGKGDMVLYFENSAVRLPSAKEDMFNGEGECSSSGSQVKKGYAYGCS
nr:hypothetical protein [Tanacetum cinerariifolium]